MLRLDEHNAVISYAFLVDLINNISLRGAECQGPWKRYMVNMLIQQPTELKDQYLEHLLWLRLHNNDFD